MALVSIITACTRADLLGGLAASVCTQTGDWEWLIQLDGDARDKLDTLRDALGDPRIDIRANPRQGGSAVTRNLALMRASGDYVLCVDDDDLLVSGAVDGLVDALAAQPACFAAWGRTRTFEADPEESVEFKSWPRAGLVGPNEIGPIFEATGEFPVHVGACLWRRTHLLAVGGYAALLRSIDTNPFLACERVFSLVYVDRDVYLYRQHAAQMTTETYYDELRSSTHAFNFARSAALASLCRHLSTK